MNYDTLYDKYLGVPKKQAKSYELDLGQKVYLFKIARTVQARLIIQIW